MTIKTSAPRSKDIRVPPTAPKFPASPFRPIEMSFIKFTLVALCFVAVSLAAEAPKKARAADQAPAAASEHTTDLKTESSYGFGYGFPLGLGYYGGLGYGGYGRGYGYPYGGYYGRGYYSGYGGYGGYPGYGGGYYGGYPGYGYYGGYYG